MLALEATSMVGRHVATTSTTRPVNTSATHGVFLRFDILEKNDGSMRFRRRDVANTPTHIQALDVGDFNKDGNLDLVTGGLHTYSPYDRMERVVLWINRWPGEPATR